MSGEQTKRMLGAYISEGSFSLFLTGLFQSPLENFHNSESVELDIMRSGEDIAIVIQNIADGYRLNKEDIYTNKSLVPAIYKEAGALQAADLIKRMPGQNPFANVEFQANASTRASRLLRKMQNKIIRAIELQAAQVLTTGTVSLTDAAGNVLFTVNYAPKTTHFPTVSNAWSGGSADPLLDLANLGEVIRNDGLEDPDQIIFSGRTYEYFLRDAKVQARLDNRRIDQGGIAPMQMNGLGGAFRGTIEIENYRYQLWTYGGRYTDPQTGNKTDYIPADKVIVRSSRGRLDATFGAIPKFAEPDQRVLRFLPDRVRNPGARLDLFFNAWLQPNNEELFVGCGARPLLIPTAIDTFGCLDTEP